MRFDGYCRLFVVLYAGSLLVAWAGGCQSAGMGQALTPELAGNDPESQLEFWHALPSRAIASNDETFHGLLLFTQKNDPAADYAGRVEALQASGLLPNDFDAAPEAGVRRGVLAVAMLRVLNIKGGVTLQAFGVSPRYATRELQYLGVFPPSSPQQTLSGSELLGIIGRAEDFKRRDPENPLDELAMEEPHGQ